MNGNHLRLIPGPYCLEEEQFKIAVGDMISIRGQVMEYMYIPTRIKIKLMRCGVDCTWKG